ncbi:tuberoinfundibular peptide of 39 residues [Zootoca vivipara]|uniref:tuberoinfundibular peptide of 39 residues n=1 Tax=Zootoca vivipara TaxID=8524 RepID=UPI0015900AAA|nr:tuberoinfundibular peptide of 39 residues [Zootoca vivipara]
MGTPYPLSFLYILLVILSSCLLLSSGAVMHNSGRLWRREVSQYPPPGGIVDLKGALVPWSLRIPSTTLRDWMLKWMSSDVTTPWAEDNEDEGQNRKSRLWGPARQESPSPKGQKVALYQASWVPGWVGKRSIVLADDAAFREKSKMLRTMERQKWLNSYMQKLLVVE